LIERYQLFAWSRVREELNRARIWHLPYQLSHARIGRCDDSLLRLNGFNSRLRQPDHVCMGESQRVKAYALE
jgi:hypothetical protein